MEDRVRQPAEVGEQLDGLVKHRRPALQHGPGLRHQGGCHGLCREARMGLWTWRPQGESSKGQVLCAQLLVEQANKEVNKVESEEWI